MEKEMMKGLISPGNGNGLVDFVKTGNEKGIANLLMKWKKEAETRNCDKVLISAESLIHAFIRPNALESLVRIANKLGFTNISALAYFRDMDDHCLSTYKHRAKRGTIASFEA